MRSLSRILVLGLTLAAFVIGPTKQATAQESKKASGSVSGRVTLAGKPVPRATVLLSPSSRASPQQTPPAKATTDEEGLYKLTGVPPGEYIIVPFTPVFVVPTETSSAQPGKTVTLGEGEEVDDIDFEVSQGGVITGRVTDPDGRPVIEQRVNLMRIDERGRRLPALYFNPSMFTTDDRGVYRLYGLAPGKYKVSVGDSPDGGTVRIGFGGGFYARTFHPDVSDESRAAIIEIRPGYEANDIDIKLGRAARSYVATGRIVDAETGSPMPNLYFGHGGLSRDQTSIGAFGWTNNRTTDKGEFRIEGLGPGRYAAFVVATEQVTFYSDPAIFEVKDADVSGVEIKVNAGSTISGTAVIEGSEDPEVFARLTKIELRAMVVPSEGMAAPSTAPIPINPDGSFKIIGLRPGKVRIFMGTYPVPKGFSLLRVEGEGVDQRYSIDVGRGEHVTGMRVVIGYGTAVLRGEVKVEGGQMPANMRLRVVARRFPGEGAIAVVDARGRFSIEGLIAGEYEVTLNSMTMTSSSPGPPGPPARIEPRALAKQNVTVVNGAETAITMVIDLGATGKEEDR